MYSIISKKKKITNNLHIRIRIAVFQFTSFVVALLSNSFVKFAIILHLLIFWDDAAHKRRCWFNVVVKHVHACARR
jgi:hypothetical protein